MAQDPTHQQRSVTLRAGTRVGAVVSRYHRDLTGAMAESARRRLIEAGLAEDAFELHSAPGAFELPILARALARRDDIDAVLCFGLVLKGQTNHDEYVAGAAARGILEASLETDKPILFGVLTCPTVELARARALPPELGGVQDKGREVASAAIETLAALAAIRGAEGHSGGEH